MSEPTKMKPILFCGPMVRAILDGRKTQTRRVIKPQPADGFDDEVLEACASVGVMTAYRPGDILWVREKHSFLVRKPDDVDLPAVWYWADGPVERGDWTKPSPSIFMPRWACRLFLRITDVRAERLHDITEADAIAEGLSRLSKDGGQTWKHGIPDRDGLPGNDDYGWQWPDWCANTRDAYKRLWDSMNAKRGYSWSVNPWVFRYGFERVEL
jgi:hypothetical protein